jgi:DNA polymerase-1
MNSDDLVFLDLESNGLNPDTIHCVVCKHRGEVSVFEDEQAFSEYYRRHSSCRFVAHNGLGFDFPVLGNLWGVQIERQVDSLVLSSLADPSRSGGHSLRSWGERTGTFKGDYKGGWEVYTEEMRDYCIGDVETLESMWPVLCKELEKFSDESIELEHEVAKIIHKQVKTGWYFRTDKAMQLLAKLKEKQYETEEAVHERFHPLPVLVKEITPKYKKDGTLSAVGLKFLGDNWTNVAGPFSRIDFPVFNLGSRQQIGKHLQYFGWKPQQFTETGQPMVDEKILEGVEGIPEASPDR